MSFEKSCLDIRLEPRYDCTVLLARARVDEGDEYVDAELFLDGGITNDNGRFSRDSSSFTESAENIHLEFRDDGVWLIADLWGGFWQHINERQAINLSEHIENQDGSLEFCT
ncbi:Cyanovirin-N [Aspergillus transmontanensis]|uniref:Cyanovirin-N n=1 Tax=Aspergillus transmontanensis TaxID=1034304 RepID=A0A5N6VUX1_9EURO|nr:Cyanovirin-N [Aspergillus transmontanensis]